MRAVFLGTPAEAVPSLEMLSSVATVVAVVTRPDRPRGRSGVPQPPSVKVAASAGGLPVMQPLGGRELHVAIEALAPFDVGVVTAYGNLIRPETLALARRGFLNVHFSLLPRWRGASPVVAAIATGDQETGVTIMELDPGLDTGPIVAARPLVIGTDETGGELTDRLAVVGAALLAEVVGRWAEGQVVSVRQPASGVRTAPRIGPGDLALDLRLPATDLARKVRALAPRPGATLLIESERFRVLAARPRPGDIDRGRIGLVDGRVLVGAHESALEILSLQQAGRRPMPAASWWRGLRAIPVAAS